MEQGAGRIKLLKAREPLTRALRSAPACCCAAAWFEIGFIWQLDVARNHDCPLCKEAYQVTVSSIQCEKLRAESLGAFGAIERQQHHNTKGHGIVSTPGQR